MPDRDRCPDCYATRENCDCPCAHCGGDGWVEDQTDPVNTDWDAGAGCYDWPLEPCEWCNPEGRDA